MRTAHVLFGLVAVTAVHAERTSFEIHPAQGSRMELSVQKTGLLRGKSHLFAFDRYRGELQFDADHPESSVVSLVIEPQSASCRDTWVSAGDLRKIQAYALKDMLAADRFPSIVFS